MDSSGLWSNHAYTRYWVGRAVSQFGSALSVIAFPLLVLAEGGRATQAGAVASCSLITRVVLRLPAGHLADRVNQRTLMVGMDLIRLAALGSIPVAGLMGWLSYPQLLVVALVEGTATALFGPAAAVSFRDLVSKEQLTAALSRGQATTATVSMVGPVAGGALFGVNTLLPFVVDAGSYLASTLLLLSIRELSAGGSPRARQGGGGDRRMIAGLVWLWRRPTVLRVLLFASLINLVGSASELAVLLGLRERGNTGAVIGLVMACAGIGGIVGSLLAGRFIRMLSPVALCALVGLVWTAGSVVLTSVTSAWLIGAVLVGLLLFAPAAGVVLGRITMGEAPRDILGRVITAEQTVTVGLASVGPILVGATLQSIGTAPTWLLLAGVCALSVLLVTSARTSRARSKTPHPQDGPDTPDGSGDGPAVATDSPEPVAERAGRAGR
ncbi:MAG TPA: MFS transporter [Mycobacteriales bacterium]|nr:MFS transporter [Mycobacteriales bacterium]